MPTVEMKKVLSETRGLFSRLSQGDLHVSSWRIASDSQRLHRNVEPGTSWIDHVQQLCHGKILPTRRLAVHELRGWKVLGLQQIDCIIVFGICAVFNNHDSLEQSGSYLFQLTMCTVNVAKPEYYINWFV